jgi:GNAT superfamily N-acetyltransferase
VIDVVPFSLEHQADVIDLILAIQQSEFGISITLEDQPDLRDIPGYYRRGSGNFWVALSGTRVIGTISLLDIGNSQGALRKMFVRAEYRGREHPVARRLLDTLIGWCRQETIHEVFLGTTAQFVAAHRFLREVGVRCYSEKQLTCELSAHGRGYEVLWSRSGQLTHRRAPIRHSLRAGNVLPVRKLCISLLRCEFADMRGLSPKLRSCR